MTRKQNREGIDRRWNVSLVRILEISFSKIGPNQFEALLVLIFVYHSEESFGLTKVIIKIRIFCERCIVPEYVFERFGIAEVQLSNI